MTRQAFMARLREGLRGLPAQTQAEILADYETHFAEAGNAGRPEAEVADALGDPDRLARELRAEAGLKRWEEARTPSSAGAAVFAAGPFVGVPGGAGAALLGGLGVMAAAASAGAVLTIVIIGLVNLLVWYGRLHYRLLKPALEPQAQGSVA